jgi:hypothetical protein
LAAYSKSLAEKPNNLALSLFAHARPSLVSVEGVAFFYAWAGLAFGILTNIGK